MGFPFHAECAFRCWISLPSLELPFVVEWNLPLSSLDTHVFVGSAFPRRVFLFSLDLFLSLLDVPFFAFSSFRCWVFLSLLDLPFLAGRSFPSVPAQGNTEEELPEVALGGVRINHLDLMAAQPLDPRVPA